MNSNRFSNMIREFFEDNDSWAKRIVYRPNEKHNTWTAEIEFEHPATYAFGELPEEIMDELVKHLEDNGMVEVEWMNLDVPSAAAGESADVFGEELLDFVELHGKFVDGSKSIKIGNGIVSNEIFRYMEDFADLHSRYLIALRALAIALEKYPEVHGTYIRGAKSLENTLLDFGLMMNDEFDVDFGS